MRRPCRIGGITNGMSAATAALTGAHAPMVVRSDGCSCAPWPDVWALAGHVGQPHGSCTSCSPQQHTTVLSASRDAYGATQIHDSATAATRATTRTEHVRGRSKCSS